MKAPLREAGLAELRHELRTPLNHIIGYSEMLLEDGGALPEACAVRLRRIHEAGQKLVPLLGAALGPGREVGEGELEELRRALAGPLASIVEDCTGLIQEAGTPAAADLERIRGAARRLLSFAGGQLTEEPAAASGGSETARQAGMGTLPGQAHLLVVDDNESNRDMLARRLERQGYRVSEAPNGQDALEMLRRGGYELVLLDIMMPGLNGIEVLGRMKADPALCDLPVIMISALDEIQSVVRSIEMGAEDYLPKPFDPVLLQARIGASLDKKRLREQLMVQEKMASLGALTAGIAHELKNPLNFVLNFAELSADLIADLRAALPPQALPPVEDTLADLEQNVVKIREHGKRADAIIRGMLMHSRQQTGERALADINALVSENLNLAYHGLRAQDPGFHATIETDFDPAAGAASVVPQDIGRVFLNIATNACYAANQKRQTSGGGFVPVVRASTRNAGPRVEIRIRDNGTGIPKAVRDRLFTPFFTTKPAGSGTGLGLSISYDIVVRQHHGQIAVDSVEGQFTEFSITLPRGEEQGTPR